MIKAVLFDLDGTLLPMEQDVFVKSYFRGLAGKMMPLGYDPSALVSAVWKGTEAMVGNDGSRTNEEAFWECFGETMGAEALRDRPVIDRFYREEFRDVRAACGHNPAASALIEEMREWKVLRVLATNPIFPRVGTLERMDWAGLRAEDFAEITTYENSRYCKPHPRYYTGILERVGCAPEECIMVGNDVEEDMIPAGALGMKTFLLTDCLINKQDRDIAAWPHGGFEELRQFLQAHVLHGKE